MKSHVNLHSDNVHFHPEGSALQGAQVAAIITELLSNRAE
jgi:hypothetical protein